MYDAWNRLVEVRDGETTAVRFEYDALNRRIEEVAGGVTKDLFYSGSWQLLEVREDGTVKEQYVWGTQYVDGLVLRNRDADGISTNGVLGLEQTHYALQDASSNVVAIADYSGMTERYDYTAYGVRTVLDAAGATKVGGSDVGWVVGHQGLFFVEAAGFYANRERFYDATTMRFVNRDPLGFGGGDVNVYRYVGNGPANGMDPSGLYGNVVAGAAIGFAFNEAANLYHGRDFGHGAGGAIVTGVLAGAGFGFGYGLGGGLGAGLSGSFALGGAAAGLTGYLANSIWNGEPITLAGAAVSTTIGAVAGPVCVKLLPRLAQVFRGKPAPAAPAPAAANKPPVLHNNAPAAANTLPVLQNKGATPDVSNPFLKASVNTQFRTDAAGRYVDARGMRLDGTYKVVVTPDGKVRYAPSEYTHPQIAGGNQVQSAGEVTFQGGRPTAADIHSGHFEPNVGQGYDRVLDSAMRQSGYNGPTVQDSFKKNF